MAGLPDSSNETLPLTFRGRLNEADVINLRHYEDLMLVGKPVRLLVVTFFSVLAVVCTWSIFTQGIAWPTALLLVFWFYLVFLLPLERIWSARREYRSRPEDHLETTVILTAERLSIENDASSTSFVWNRLKFVCDTPDGLLFCSASTLSTLFWLPNRVLEGRLREQVLELVRQQGIPIKNLE